MSKSEAEAIRDRLRAQIREGTLRDTSGRQPDARLTFGDVADQYLERHVRVPSRRVRAVQQAVSHLRILRRAEVPGPGGRRVALADKRIDVITKADVESIRESRRRNPERPGNKGGEVGINRLLARLRHVFSWAIGEGYTTENLRGVGHAPGGARHVSAQRCGTAGDAGSTAGRVRVPRRRQASSGYVVPRRRTGAARRPRGPSGSLFVC